MPTVDAARPNTDSPAPVEGTAGAVLAFLDYTVAKGHVKRATAKAMQVAVREVLAAAEGEGWERRSVRDLDVDDVLRRFQTLRAMKYKPESLHTYSQRFASAIRMYQEFSADPRSWRPTVRTRTVRSRPRPTPVDSERVSISEADVREVTAEEPVMTEIVHGRPALIPYPFPLRDGVLVSLHLPADLTRREASRLVAFIQSLAVDHEHSETVSES